jgi:hypothetical protein
VTISEDTIKNAVLRYHREYDRYLKLSARVAEICRFEIVEGNAIRAQVTFPREEPEKPGGQAPPLCRVGEEGACRACRRCLTRCATSRPCALRRTSSGTRTRSSQLVCKRFVDLKGADAGQLSARTRTPSDNNNFYRATHVEAFLPEADVIGTYANVSDVPCESPSLQHDGACLERDRARPRL